MADLLDVDGLRTIYKDPGPRAQAKVIHALDGNCRAFLERCPFLVFATADGDGRCDASPRGGAPGFVHVLDDHRLAFADLSGNNRLDSFQNVVANPNVGLLCMVPGRDETLRVNGRATLSDDPELCAALAIDARPAKVVVVVEVAEAYIHCAKALRRGGVWDPERWPDQRDLPSAACMLRDHTGYDVDAQAIEDGLEENYRATMWEPGGSAV
jgi:PPOX class probable FMN-dependent enzyme